MWRQLGKLLALGVCRHFAKRSTAAVETAALVLVLTQKHVGRGPKRDVLVRAAHVIFIPAAIIKGVRLTKRLLGKRTSDRLPPPSAQPLVSSSGSDPLSAATIPTFRVQPPPLPKPLPRSDWGFVDIAQVAPTYAAWTRLLSNVLAQQGLRSLPPDFDPDGLELTRYLLYGGILAATKPADATRAVAATAQRVVSTINWRSTFEFMGEEEIKEWEDVFWWVGPDPDGTFWLHIHLARAVARAAQGEGRRCGQAVVSQLDRATRVMMKQAELAAAAALAGADSAEVTEGEAADVTAPPPAAVAVGGGGSGGRALPTAGGRLATAASGDGDGGPVRDVRVDDRIRVVIVGSGSNVRQALRMLHLMREFSALTQRHYPGRLRTMHLVDMPRGLRMSMSALLSLLPVDTRKKVKVCKTMDLPDHIASALVTHEEALAAARAAGRTPSGGLRRLASGKKASGGGGGLLRVLGSPRGGAEKPAAGKAGGGGDTAPASGGVAGALTALESVLVLRLLLLRVLPALLMALTACLTFKGYQRLLLRW